MVALATLKYSRLVHMIWPSAVRGCWLLMLAALLTRLIMLVDQRGKLKFTDAC